MTKQIFHVITGLDRGGAETMLLKLASKVDLCAFTHVVYVLSPNLSMLPNFERQKINVKPLNIRGLWSLGEALLSVRSAAVKERPIMLMSWLHHADLFAVFLKCLTPSLNIIWNIRCSRLRPGELPLSNIILTRMLASLSFIPAAVITNSIAGRVEHKAIGYKPRRWIYLPNGFEMEIFRPDKEVKNEQKRLLNLEPNDFVVGLVGRYHPMKGYGLFAEAAAIICKKYPSVRFLLIGKGLDRGNKQLLKLLNYHGVDGETILLGEREDIFSIMNTFDIFLNTSTSEGFPNVIGEAMACGVPCVATDVGDCRSLIGDTGLVVSPDSPVNIAIAIESLVKMPSDELQLLGQSARERVELSFSMPKILQRYQDLFDEFV